MEELFQEIDFKKENNNDVDNQILDYLLESNDI